MRINTGEQQHGDYEHYVVDEPAPLLEFLLNALIAGITTCLSMYSALSIGYGCARHKMLFSVIALYISSKDS